MKYLLTSFFLIFTFSLMASHRIYLIHGYGSPKFVLNKIERNIKKNGFQTINYGYPSVAEDLDNLGHDLYLNIKEAGYDTVSFVTHSMGALVVRSMLRFVVESEKFPVIFRMVMIAPPNKGADIADLYASNKLLKPFLGPNFKHMTTDSLSFTNKLPVPVNSEVGIIVGIKGNEHGYNPLIKGDNDGRLKPERTDLANEKDKAVIHDEHTHLTQNPRVVKLVIEFLKEGIFLSKE
jgi:hypothetical protein